MSANDTHAELAAHLKKWSAKGKPGFNCGPLEAHREMVRWICGKLDQLATLQPASPVGKEKRRAAKTGNRSNI